MNRREFLAAGAAAAGACGLPAVAATESGADSPTANATMSSPMGDEPRALFPWIEREIYLNAARGTPLSTFSAAAIDQYQELLRYGYGGGRDDPFFEMMDEIRGRFGALIGARASEIAMTQCTKGGEQIVLDRLPKLRAGGNVVTNDFHYAGSLHNLLGLRQAGTDVRIVRAAEDWTLDPEAMIDAIDDDTALVAVTLVSNVNGRIEPMHDLVAAAHAKGALVYADIIQAAGIMPFDVRELGIDFAACSGYKWMFGVRGTAFFYVRDEHQGKALVDRVFPGSSEPLYDPWTAGATPEGSGVDGFSYRAPTDARRYQPGHISYIGFCALYEGIRFIHRIGVEAMLRHSVTLNRRLLDQVDLERYPCISPDVDRSPIVTFLGSDQAGLKQRLKRAGVAVTLHGPRIRVSPAIYNTPEDMDRLAAVLAET
ncbi:MAG: aminotransferase class V-fold PLP-dependent enzyme [Acidobacteriota bacterium]